MKLLRTISSGGLAVAAAMALAACTTSGPSGPSSVAQTPVGIEGTWLDAKGVALSTFSAGNFTTVDAQTGTKLAEGSYTKTTENSVQVNGTSSARGNAPLGLNCLLVSGSQLNCTAIDGNHYTFTRRT
ncbi:hypothetical protein [Mesorhizobium sp. A556]